MQRHETNPDPPGRCTRCGGWRDIAEDRWGAYIRCRVCGEHTYPGAEPSGPDAPERDTPPLCAWYPTTDAAQDRYRRIREIILEEHLGPEAAMERFAFSKRTYYRIKNGEKLEEDLGRFEGV